MSLLDLVQEAGVVQIIEDMTRQMTEEELNDKLAEYVEEYKNSHYVEENEIILEQRSFWRNISTNDLCADFLRHFQEKLAWELVSSCNNSLTLDTIEEFEDKIQFNKLTQNRCLTTEMFLIYQDRLNKKYVSCKIMGEDYLIENKDKYDFGWCSISDNCHDFSNNFFSKCSDKLYWWRISRWNQNINEEFIQLFHDQLDWCDLIQWNGCSNELLVEYKNFIETKQFLKNYNYSKTFKNMEDTREQYCYDILSQIFKW